VPTAQRDLRRIAIHLAAAARLPGFNSRHKRVKLAQHKGRKTNLEMLSAVARNRLPAPAFYGTLEALRTR
jgi:hypothetical protein